MKTIEVVNDNGMNLPEFSVVLTGREVGQAASEIDTTYELTLQGKTVARCELTGSWAGPLQSIPASILQIHHDPACRTYAGMALVLSIVTQRAAMQTDPVSALIFRPLAQRIVRAGKVP